RCLLTLGLSPRVLLRKDPAVANVCPQIPAGIDRMDGEILKMKFNKMFGMLLVATTALGTVACHKHSYTVGAGGNTEGEAAYKKWESHWFFGMIGESQVKVSEVCPSGNATIKDSRSFLNGLVSAFTG